MEWLHETWSKARVLAIPLRVGFAVLVVLALGLIPAQAQTIAHPFVSGGVLASTADRAASGGNEQGSGPAPLAPSATFKAYLPFVGKGNSTTGVKPGPTPSPTPISYPSTYKDKINQVADYSQTDSAYGGFPDGGLNYCAPVAVSDSLMWLSDHGFPNLASHSSDRKYDQYQLINALASYFGTDPYSGTGANTLVPGLKQYIQARGYAYTSLLLEGWKYVPAEFNTGVKVPNLDWIKRGVLGSGSVWLNVGFYTYSSATNTYTRYGGHWVALVGYDPTYLIVHNSGLANGYSITNQYTAPQLITSGYLAGGGSGQPSSAVGFYKLSGYSSIHIVDAAVVLQMPTPSSALSLGTVLGPPEPLATPGTVLTDGD